MSEREKKKEVEDVQSVMNIQHNSSQKDFKKKLSTNRVFNCSRPYDRRPIQTSLSPLYEP